MEPSNFGELFLNSVSDSFNHINRVSCVQIPLAYELIGIKIFADDIIYFLLSFIVDCCVSKVMFNASRDNARYNYSYSDTLCTRIFRGLTCAIM